MTNVLIVTGMHRSGTSLVAHYLMRSGVDLGSDFLPPDVGNPHGYYEDKVIHDFHQRALRKHGIADAFTVADDQLPILPTDEDRTEARAIVERVAAREQWGWKEPRTALFLELWSELLPDATFLFVFRSPDNVLDSLMRRASNASVIARPVTGLEVWYAYNSEMYRFSRAHPERCLWVEVDRFVADPNPVLEELGALGFELTAVPMSEVLVENDLHHDVRMRARATALRHPGIWRRCSRLYRQLQLDEGAGQRTHARPYTG